MRNEIVDWHLHDVEHGWRRIVNSSVHCIWHAHVEHGWRRIVNSSVHCSWNVCERDHPFLSGAENSHILPKEYPHLFTSAVRVKYGCQRWAVVRDDDTIETSATEPVLQV